MGRRWYPRRVAYPAGMCRSIVTLRRPDEPATDEEVRAAALQFVRKISGYRKPSQRNEAAFEAAVDDIAAVSRGSWSPSRRRSRPRAFADLTSIRRPHILRHRAHFNVKTRSSRAQMMNPISPAPQPTSCGWSRLFARRSAGDVALLELTQAVRRQSPKPEGQMGPPAFLMPISPLERRNRARASPPVPNSGALWLEAGSNCNRSYPIWQSRSNGRPPLRRL